MNAELPPIQQDNPVRPRRRRPDPDDESPVDKTVSTAASALPKSTPVAQPVSQPPTVGLSLNDLMRGNDDPYSHLTHSGIRVPQFLMDAVRLAAQLSKGKRSQQSIVIEALEQFLPDELLNAAWIRHGGQPGGRRHPKGQTTVANSQ